MENINNDDDDKKTAFSFKLVRRMIGLLRIRRFRAIIFIMLILIVSVQDAVFTYLNKFLIDEGIVAHNLKRMFEIISWFVGVALVQSVCVFSFIILAGLIGERVCIHLRQKMFENLQRLSFSYFNRNTAGRIISRLTSDALKIADFITWGILVSVWATINIITSIIFMTTINWKLALIVLGFLPVIVFLAVIFQVKIFAHYQNVRKYNSRIITWFNETIMGHRVVKAFCREDANYHEFTSITGEMYNASYRAAVLSAFFLPITQLVGSFMIGAIIWLGGFQFSQGSISIGGIQSFISYVAFILWPIREIARVWISMQNSLAAAARVFTLMDEAPEIRNREGAKNPMTLRRKITLSHVDFSYLENEPVFDDFNLVIEPGQTIALVGPTGSGKSTIINLICRFYEPVSGSIMFDDIDYRDFTLNGLQSRFGIVLQSPHLFSGTIRENIRYGKPDAADEEVEKAARITQAHEFIITLPDGYDTEAGETGNLLSVGQKQLISLARAVITDPDIFIMDEATSSIDTYTEKLIQQGLKSVMIGRTSIIIAHRLSTISHADRILVLEKGKLVEDGSHDELIRQQGKYYRLYSRTTGAGIAAICD